MRFPKLIPVASLLLLLGCSSTTSGNNATDGGGDAPSCVTGTVSFKMQVYPVFQRSCGLSSSCHKDPNINRVYLGASTDSNASGVVMRIVNKPSVDAPSLPFVKPKDPGSSFLMHKIDGDLASIATDCAGDCMSQMPMGGPPFLDQCTQDTIRAWITQGAADN
jgi:hypothetical protein